MKNTWINAAKKKVGNSCLPYLFAAKKKYFFMYPGKIDNRLNKSVYAWLLGISIVKTRSNFSPACSKKMTIIVMQNAIYIISLRFEPISNIHLNQ